MMCLRDKPWLLTRTSPFAPPKMKLTKSCPFLCFGVANVLLTPVELRADYNIVAIPAKLFDRLSHDDF
jgi:hypothetical protein